MAAGTFTYKMIHLSATKATRDTQVNADPRLKMYCWHSLYRSYVILFGESPPALTAGTGFS